jgi:hypothetical protein
MAEDVPSKLLHFNPSDWPNEHVCITKTPVVDGATLYHGGYCGWIPQFCQWHKARLQHPGLSSIDVIHEDHKPNLWGQESQEGVYEVWKDGQQYHLQADGVTWVAEDGSVILRHAYDVLNGQDEEPVDRQHLTEVLLRAAMASAQLTEEDFKELVNECERGAYASRAGDLWRQVEAYAPNLTRQEKAKEVTRRLEEYGVPNPYKKGKA